MPKQKQPPKSVKNGNGKDPEPVTQQPQQMEMWPEEEVTQAPPADEGWSDAVASTEETGEALDPAKEYIQKLDTSPKWDGSWTGKPEPQQADWKVDETGEPVPYDAGTEGWGAEASSKGVDDNLSVADAGEAQATADADLNTLDDWNTGSALENETLIITRHPGRFIPEQAKILIYGETGTQKTRMAATFPNVIIADVDHGMGSVDWEVDKVFIPDDKSGFRKLQQLHSMLASGNHEFETVVLDTLNEMQRVIMRFTVDEYTTVRRSYGSLPGQSDYGFMLYQFMELTRQFISLPMRVVLLAQINSQQFDTDTMGPQLIGKNTAREILRKMDVVGYLYKAEAEEGTAPEMTFDAVNFATKDRSHKLPTALRMPTYQRMAAYWK